jgi:hypothetical protein
MVIAVIEKTKENCLCQWERVANEVVRNKKIYIHTTALYIADLYFMAYDGWHKRSHMAGEL